MTTQNKFPLGWDEQRVRQTIEHYERQSEDEAVAEDEAAFDNQDQAFVQVPLELLPLVRELIAKHYASI
ncbi:hypothetical protein [Planktothrix sp. FACHB-1365]|uniref:hypothetical protein n=1 Tax=Planktothrix sp. FACHB-1365 TaxID=2692855 RepID=UPI0016854DAA|nr:hypothetical protein [Planktothrix sp. FACHB-1365]MBD2484480.1 hypothetical protein [Planktothrix sp. FACHB-1365]